MAMRSKSNVVLRVIGDVVDAFDPSLTVRVNFGNKHITNGCSLKPSEAIVAPTVTISGSPDELYAMIMTDPDEPNPSESSLREWVHWITINIPGNGRISPEGTVVLPYIPPHPTIGVHRYVMVLFRQTGRIGGVEPPQSRAYFNTRMYSRQLGLGSPVAAVYFYSKKEPANRMI